MGRNVTTGKLEKWDHKKKRLYAYRVNFKINLTKMTLPLHRQAKNSTLTEHKLQLYRDTIFYQRASSSSSAGHDERLCYPCYKMKKWLTKNGDISVALDHGVKSLNWIKLVGYSVFNKRQVGFAHMHEQIADDWVALRIDEVKGDVLSNNANANGAFAVLHVGGSQDNVVGAIEYHQHDSKGIHTHHFDNHQAAVRNLHMQLTDRQGKPAHFGRIHLWFQLGVAHG